MYKRRADSLATGLPSCWLTWRAYLHKRLTQRLLDRPISLTEGFWVTVPRGPAAINSITLQNLVHAPDPRETDMNDLQVPLEIPESRRPYVSRESVIDDAPSRQGPGFGETPGQPDRLSRRCLWGAALQVQEVVSCLTGPLAYLVVAMQAGRLRPL